MEKDELFEAVREINKLVVESERRVNDASVALKEALPLIQQVLDATRKQTTQSSLDEFDTQKSRVTALTNEANLAKSNVASKMISELFALEDIRKMLEGE